MTRPAALMFALAAIAGVVLLLHFTGAGAALIAGGSRPPTNGDVLAIGVLIAAICSRRPWPRASAHPEE